jgi:HEAT repeat protein
MIGANGGLVLRVTEVLTALVILLVLTTSGARAWRRRQDRLRAEAEAAARPLILEALDQEPGADGPEEGEEEQAPRLDARTSRVLDTMAAAMAGKLRGADRSALVRLLQRRGTVDVARRRTGSQSAGRRLRAVELLGALGITEAVPELVGRLDDADAEVRRAAVRALGRTGSADAVPALLALLDAPHRTESAHYITLALLRIGPRAGLQLTTALRTHGPRGREAAAKVLGWLGETGAVEALERSLSDEVPEVRAAAVEALGRIGLPGSAPAMRVLLGPDEPEWIRVRAAVALGRLGDPASIDLLAGLLGESHVLARSSAAALAQLGPRGLAALRESAVVPEVAEVLASLEPPPAPREDLVAAAWPPPAKGA